MPDRTTSSSRAHAASLTKQAPIGSPHILVIGPAWIGDMVMTQSLFKHLRQQYPQCTIDVAAPGWTLPVLERTPEVREALALPFKHGEFAFWQRLRLGKSWRQRGYDWAILIPNSWKSALLPAAAGIKRRTGWLGEQRYGLLNDIRSLDKKKLSLMVERFMALAMPASEAMPRSCRLRIQKSIPWPEL